MAFEINFLAHNVALVHGVTDGTGDTALTTLPPNPFNDARVFAMVFGEGCYVEDANSDKPEQSGVLAATIDIRSSAASKSFKCLVIRLTSGEGLVRDHSSVTT
jgi:hypothetical protein